MRRKPGLGLARDGSVGKAGGATFARLSSSLCWTFLSGIFARRLIVRSVFPLRRNEAKRDDGCGGRPVAHPSALIHAIMQVLPNERRHNHSNAEPQGRLLTKRKDRIMKISARNQIKGTVKTVKEGAVNAVVTICRGNHNPIKADITMEAVKQLGLEEGKECYAVVKATNVMFATSKIEGISARNQIEGTVVKVQEGAVNGHVTIEDEEGVRISGSITNESIESLGLKEGGKAVAIIKAADVMVAVD